MDQIYLLNHWNQKPEIESDPSVEEETITSVEQEEIEHLIKKTLKEHFLQWLQTGQCQQLNHSAHSQFLYQKLAMLPMCFQTSDSSQTWILYWIIHSCRLLKLKLSKMVKSKVIEFLATCQNSGGGFGGGPQQISHLAATYAAVSCLASLQTTQALDVIDRRALLNWLSTLRQSDGSFALYASGEVDIRGSYCALAVTTLLNISTEHLFDGTANWVLECQTYEGGFGGHPESEAHAGYTFCAVATLCLLKQTEGLNVDALLRWAASRQMKVEGGFQGRTNKFVSSCYSYWMGAVFFLIETIINSPDGTDTAQPHHQQAFFQPRAVQEFLLAGCQKNPSCFLTADENPQTVLGGFSDMPTGNADLYHTCYALSGLYLAQVYDKEIVGGSSNKIEPNDVLYNVTNNAVQFIKKYFYETLST